MSGDVHVRFYESLGVQLLRATHPFGRYYSPKNGRCYLGTRPSTKSVSRVMKAMHETINRRWLGLKDEEMVERINSKLTGWANYFCLGTVSKAYKVVDAYTTNRLRQWLCKKHKVRSTGNTRVSYEYLHEHLGLIRLTRRTRHLLWARA